MGGCQNYGPFLGTLNIRCRNIIGTPKGTIILTTTNIGVHEFVLTSPLDKPAKSEAVDWFPCFWICAPGPP